MYETVEVFCINQHEQPFMSFSCEHVDWVNKAGSSHKLEMPAGDGPWHEDVFAGRYRGICTQSYWTTTRMCRHRQKLTSRIPVRRCVCEMWCNIHPFFYLFKQEVCPCVTTLLVLEYRLGRCHGSLGHKYPWKCDYVQHMSLRVRCHAG